MTYSKILFALTLFVVGLSTSYAGSPLWTFTPLTATEIDIPVSGTATVQYLVTNQSILSHTLAMESIKGITQLTTGVGICGNPFTLTGKSSCVLSLEINGSQVASGNTNAPIICSASSKLQCYRPSAADTLKVTVNTAPGATTLSASAVRLSLKINGASRTITITNTGSFPAQGLSINFPVWPSGTIATSACSATLAAGASCEITVIPGSNATSDCGSGQGSMPTPGMITVSASNASSSLMIDVTILTYGCIYQEGFLFGIDDTPPPNLSVTGKTASMVNVSSGIQWDNGSFITTNAVSLVDGLQNTSDIITAQGAGNYAASLCSNYSVDSEGNSPCSAGVCYINWYLPAICELGAAGGGAGCSVGLQNIETNLPGLIVGCTGPSCILNNYWSSTEVNSSLAWYQFYSSGGTVQHFAAKADNSLSVRCIRNAT